MTLAEWAEGWPYLVNWHPRIPLAPDYWMWTPDTVNNHRRLAWRLSDYRVTSVSGGSIWFRKREDTND